MKIEITDNFKDIAKRISRVINKIENMNPYYDYFGTLMIASVDKNFDAEGRFKSKGSVYGGGKKWKKYKNKSYRDWKVSHSPSYSPKILQMAGKLRTSMTYNAYADRCEFGTNLPYARIHNEGGTIDRTSKKGKSYSIDIPARPYIVIQDEDINAWLEYVLSDIEKLL